MVSTHPTICNSNMKMSKFDNGDMEQWRNEQLQQDKQTPDAIENLVVIL